MVDSLAKRVYVAAHVTGTFSLRSGATASEYFDKYQIEADPALLRAVAEQMVPSVPNDAEVLAGLELGGVPLVTMLAQLTGLPACFVRKVRKTYGTGRQVEGTSPNGRRVVVVEDVVTSGGAVIDAVGVLRSLNGLVDTVVCMIDRGAGGDGSLRAEDLELRAAFHADQLLAAARSSAV